VSREVPALTAALFALLAGGCAQIFGFDETQPYDDVRLSWSRKRIGTEVIVEPEDLTAETATALIIDANDPTGLRRVPATLEDSDTWIVELPPGTPGGIQYSLPDDDVERIWTFPNRTLDGVYGILGHPNPEPAPPNAQIDLSITLDAPYNGEGLQMYTVGGWSVRGYPEVPAAGMGITAWDPPPVPYSSYGSITGRPLERITSADTVYLLRYSGNQLAGIMTAPPFDQQDGVDTITGTMTSVILDQTLDATFRTTVAGPRYTGTRPGVAGLAMSWGITSTPAAEIGNNTGPQLHAGGLLETDTGAVNVMFGDPFPWPAAVGFSTYESRTFTPPGAAGATTLYAGMYSIDAPGTGQVYDLPQGLPLIVTLGGTALTTDGQILTIDRTKSIEVSYVLDRENACDLYGLAIYELRDNGAGTYVYVGRVAMNGLEPQFTIPGELFESGTFYTLRAVCQLGGVPGLATGDLVTRSWPMHVGYLDSGVIQVSP
jgi:hypothetical protein